MAVYEFGKSSSTESAGIEEAKMSLEILHVFQVDGCKATIYI